MLHSIYRFKILTHCVISDKIGRHLLNCRQDYREMLYGFWFSNDYRIFTYFSPYNLESSYQCSVMLQLMLRLRRICVSVLPIYCVKVGSSNCCYCKAEVRLLHAISGILERHLTLIIFSLILNSRIFKDHEWFMDFIVCASHFK